MLSIGTFLWFLTLMTTFFLGAGCAGAAFVGAVRCGGGVGFGGTILCFVPREQTESFVRLMDGIFGKDSCRVLRIRPIGGAELGGDHVMSV